MASLSEKNPKKYHQSPQALTQQCGDEIATTWHSISVYGKIWKCTATGLSIVSATQNLQASKHDIDITIDFKLLIAGL